MKILRKKHIGFLTTSVLFLVLAVCSFIGVYGQGRADHDSPLKAIKALSSETKDLKPIFRSGRFEGVDKIFFSTDGKRVITVGSSVSVWSFEKERELQFVNAEEDVEVAVYSPLNDRIAIAASGKISLWDAISGEKLETLDISPPKPSETKISTRSASGKINTEILKERQPIAESMQFSPDGRSLVIDRNDGIFFWNLERKRIFFSIAGNGGSLIGFSADSSETYISDDSNVYVLETKTGKSLRAFDKRSLLALRFISPGGKYLLGLDMRNNNLEFIDPSSGALMKSLKESDPEAYVRSAAFSHDDSLVAVFYLGGKVSIFETQSFRKIRDLDNLTRYGSFGAFSPDGKLLATGSSGGVRFWNVRNGRLLKTFGSSTEAVNSFQFDSSTSETVVNTADGSLFSVALAGKSAPEFYSRTISNGRQLFTSDDGSLIALQTRKYDEDSGESEYRLALFDKKANKKIAEVETGAIDSMEYSKQAELLAIGKSNGEIELRDARTGKRIGGFKYSVPGDEALLPAVAISPDGKWLAASSLHERKIGVMNVKSGETFFLIGKGYYPSIKFAPNSKTLAAVQLRDSDDIAKEIVQFDVIARKRLAGSIRVSKTKLESTDSDYIEGEIPYYPERLNFSPDGKLLALTGDEKDAVAIWNLETGKPHVYHLLPRWYESKGHFSIVNINNDKVLIRNDGESITYFEANTRKPIAKLFFYKEGNWVVSTPDGRFDASKGALNYIHFTDGKRVVMGNVYKSNRFTKGLLQEVLGY